jgi:hypothetical protein
MKSTMSLQVDTDTLLKLSGRKLGSTRAAQIPLPA